MIEFKGQTLRDIARVMYQIIERFDAEEEHNKDDLINPDAPVIVQFGDYGYEIFSIGGDPDLDNFVLMLKPQKVCEWRETGAFKLKGNK